MVYELKAYPNDIDLNNVILMSQNKQHYLIGNDNKLSSLNLNIVDNNLKFNGVTLGVKNTDKLLYDTIGDIVALNNSDKEIWSSNTNMNTLNIDNNGYLVFRNTNKFIKYYLYQLIDKIPIINRVDDNNINIKILQSINDKINVKYFGEDNINENKNTLQIKKQLVKNINVTNDKIANLKKVLNNKNITPQEKNNITSQIKILSDQKQMLELKHNELKNISDKIITDKIDNKTNLSIIKNQMKSIKSCEQEKKVIISKSKAKNSESDNESDSESNGEFRDKYKSVEKKIKKYKRDRGVELIKKCGYYKKNISTENNIDDESSISTNTCDDIEMIVKINRIKNNKKE
jgi:hypothetical protein